MLSSASYITTRANPSGIWWVGYKIIQIGMDHRKSLVQHTAQSRASCGFRLGSTGLYPAGSWKPAMDNLLHCLICLRAKNTFLIPTQKVFFGHALLWTACLHVLADLLKGTGVCCMVSLMLSAPHCTSPIPLASPHRANTLAPTIVAAFAELAVPEWELISGSHA